MRDRSGRVSHRGDRLDGASFRARDIRGWDFSNASLRHAEFRGVRAGRTSVHQMALVLAALLVSVGLGTMTGLAGQWLHQAIVSPQTVTKIVGVIEASSLVVVIGFSLWKGLGYAMRYTVPPIASLAAVSGVIAIALAEGTGSGALAMLAFVAVMLSLIVLSTLARAAAGTTGLAMFFVVAISGAIAGDVAGGGLTAAAVAVASAIHARRSLSGTERSPGLARVTDWLSCLGGTRFRGADLTGACFDQAHLQVCDFRGARLADASFRGADLGRSAFDPDTVRAAIPAP